ncbi:MAG: type II secretion system protein M [Deltaproteobacteria bacterium]|nr:type II secretion system protein M [Deltaproteobacteria bacterium]
MAAVSLKERMGLMASSFSSMSKRERTMIVGVAGAVLFLVFVILWYVISDSLDERAQRVENMRRALTILIQKGDKLRQARMAEARADARIESSSVPLLQGYIDGIAKKVNIDVKEYKSLKPRFLDKKKKYQERSIRLKLLGVDLDSLSRFLDRIEGGRGLVMTTQLSIVPRTGQSDQLDVDLVISTYEKASGKNEDKKKSKKRHRTSSRKPSRSGP